MRIRPSLAKAIALIFALVAASCSAAGSNSTVTSGMTPDQAVQAMGQPDLKDSIPDPNHSGGTVLRYVWLDSGKVAVFGSDNRVASIQPIEPAQQVKAETEASNQPPQEFDPIETPLNYTFFPVKAAFIYLGAGLNCVAGGGCHKPDLPSPSHS
ncbi:MAG TPA: hypothetical protein VJX23_00915 [Candidatus Binataceae bacterium]|nr:hypothetical protein [Candidatus Binataceae bacterium]